MAYSPELIDQLIKAQDAFVWETDAWEHRERGPRWYIIMSVIALGFVAYAVITGNFLFAFLILLAASILIITGHQQAHKILVQIGHNGVVLSGKLYEHKNLSNFSVIYHPPETKILYLESGNLICPRLRIPLENQDPIQIRNFLKQYLDENLVLQEEHVSDILGRLLRI